jgi:hypothetical protein
MTAPVPVPAAPGAPWWTRTQAGVLFAALLVVAVWFFFRWAPVAHWITYWTGQDNEAGGHYGFWSGFSGGLPDILLLTAFTGYIWHNSCHLSGCWLPGRHDTAGGTVRLCRFHHPDIRGRKMTQALARELHDLHLGRLARHR